MISERTIKKTIYPVLRFLLFPVSAFVAFLLLSTWLGDHTDGVYYVLKSLMMFGVSVSFSSLLLFIVGKVCKVEVPRRTYIWLAVPALCYFIFLMGILVISFIVSYAIYSK